jgi:cellulose synthase/poly-beta-1,6-N-acetylglucosamine synthase-like glycosyltransferase
MLLPALASKGLPVPLGGTSMYLKRSVLTSIGGWDAFNVTEDADLGIRLHRLGYRTAVLNSTTYEEATSDFVNWVKQRSRWYKGYMQTWLVHSRHPRRLWRELGPRGFISFQLTIGATPLVPLINPLFWTLTLLWSIGHFPFIAALFPSWLYYPGMVCMVLGNFSIIYANILGARLGGYPDLLGAILLAPIYWVMMSIAALKAASQLIRVPTFWEKTRHGLDRQPQVEGSLAID